ncbi:MAG: phage portal protein [Turicibacter sp.]|nr:phage portal protein [Turicibacter sp.]
MNLLDLFKRKTARTAEIYKYFEYVNGYSPVFSTKNAGLYEMELTRAAIHVFANAVSKLKMEFFSSSTDFREDLRGALEFRPNADTDSAKFLYRLATAYLMQNNAFIVPVVDFDEWGERVVGYRQVLPSSLQIIRDNGRLYVQMTDNDGRVSVLEYAKIGHLTQFQYENDYFGADNRALEHTLKLIETHNSSIETAVKNSATVRFLAKVANKFDDKVIKRARDAFAESNLTADNKSGLIVYDNTFADFVPINSTPYTVDTAQLQLIHQNIYNYFGVSENMLQNKFSGDDYNAFYQGKIEPFAMRLGLVLTNMTFSAAEVAAGNRIVITNNNLLTASDKTKLEFSTSLVDRGIITPNEARAVWGLKPLEGGDSRIVRRDYIPAELLGVELTETPT